MKVDARCRVFDRDVMEMMMVQKKNKAKWSEEAGCLCRANANA